MIGNESSARSGCAWACGAILLMSCPSVLGRSAATTVKGPSTAVSQVATRYGFTSCKVHGKQIILALANATRDIIRQRRAAVARACERTLSALGDSFLFPRLCLAEGTHIACACPLVNRSRRRSRPPTLPLSGRRERITISSGRSLFSPLANMALGYSLQKSLLKRTGTEDRGVRRSRFWVVRNAPCPAALVECGFVSNGKEARRLLDAEYQGRVARALAEGVLAYLDAVRRTQPVRSSTCCGRGQYDNQT